MEKEIVNGREVTVFSEADREAITRLCDRIMDEMNDSHALEDMFAPYSEIVNKLLTDVRIDRDWNETGGERQMKHRSKQAIKRMTIEQLEAILDTNEYDEATQLTANDEFERRQYEEMKAVDGILNDE